MGLYMYILCIVTPICVHVHVHTRVHNVHVLSYIVHVLSYIVHVHNCIYMYMYTYMYVHTTFMLIIRNLHLWSYSICPSTDVYSNTVLHSAHKQE